jgi:hypothetical protein
LGLTPTESDEEARAAVTQGVEALIQAGVDARERCGRRCTDMRRAKS